MPIYSQVRVPSAAVPDVCVGAVDPDVPATVERYTRPVVVFLTYWSAVYEVLPVQLVTE